MYTAGLLLAEVVGVIFVGSPSPSVRPSVRVSIPRAQPQPHRAGVAALSPGNGSSAAACPAVPGSDGCPRHPRGTAALPGPRPAGTARWAPGRAWHCAPAPTHPPCLEGNRVPPLAPAAWQPPPSPNSSQPLITQTVSAADGETAPLPRILSSSHSNSRRCGGFLIRQRLGSGCCQLLLALGAKDHHPLMALTSRMGAGICRPLQHSSLA